MFIYFDLGNVLLNFSHERACRQMGQVAGVAPERVREVVFDSGLQDHFEAGRLSGPEFHETFCRETGSQPAYNALAFASGDIFWVNVAVKAILSSLHAAGHRLGLLSNTCDWHWNVAAGGRFRLIPEVFDVVALSFRLHSIKPEGMIFDRAAELAGVAPADIFFVDDRPENVAAARAAGFDAVAYTTPATLAADLRQRGFRFNL
jgi:FMN phosphatase YigB (HAD superfamily)